MRREGVIAFENEKGRRSRSDRRDNKTYVVTKIKSRGDAYK
jgi:hypothetical protein